MSFLAMRCLRFPAGVDASAFCQPMPSASCVTSSVNVPLGDANLNSLVASATVESALVCVLSILSSLRYQPAALEKSVARSLPRKPIVNITRVLASKIIALTPPLITAMTLSYVAKHIPSKPVQATVHRAVNPIFSRFSQLCPPRSISRFIVYIMGALGTLGFIGDIALRIKRRFFPPAVRIITPPLGRTREVDSSGSSNNWIEHLREFIDERYDSARGYVHRSGEFALMGRELTAKIGSDEYGLRFASSSEKANYNPEKNLSNFARNTRFFVVITRKADVPEKPIEFDEVRPLVDTIDMQLRAMMTQNPVAAAWHGNIGKLFDRSQIEALEGVKYSPPGPPSGRWF